MLHWKAKVAFLVAVAAIIASFVGDLEGFVW
jgi:hypothetical protein